MGHRDDLLVTRQYTRMTNAAGGPPTRSVCLLGFVQVAISCLCRRGAENPCHRKPVPGYAIRIFLRQKAAVNQTAVLCASAGKWKYVACHGFLRCAEKVTWGCAT